MVGVVAAALVSLVLVGGTVATAWQAHRAREAQARAERRFNDVRRLANPLLFRYHDAIKDLPGATAVREQLLRDAVSYLDTLARESHGDPSLQRELASGYRRIGDLAARDTYRRSFAIWSDLAARGLVYPADTGRVTAAARAVARAEAALR